MQFALQTSYLFQFVGFGMGTRIGKSMMSVYVEM